MARTISTMLPLGTKAPDFTLLDTVSGDSVNLYDSKGIKGTLIMFICNHCPFVKHINSEISKLGKHYISKGINLLAISSNDAKKYPEDGPHKMKENAMEQDFIFPYLYDASQNVAKKFDAACTPDFFLFDSELQLVYRGQLDDSRPGNNIPVTGKDLRNAMDSLLNNSPISPTQKPSIGCNIKWKAE